MLGMLEIDKSIRKTQIDYKWIPDNKIISVKIPTLKKRHLKKAAKLLSGKRVIIEDGCAEGVLLKYGISPLIPRKLHRYLTGQIYKEALEEFKIPPEKAYVSIYAGRIGGIDRFGFDEIIKNARHISVVSADGSELSEYMFENYGISPVRYERCANIIIHMYENDFSLCFKSDCGEFHLKEISVAKDERINEISSTYLKSAYLALIEEGRLKPGEINIEKLRFAREN